MPAEQLEHFTVRCADLDATRDFYAAILGLTVGPRPDFPFKGHWLYCGGVPVVHLVDKAETEQRHSDRAHIGPDTGALDHVAFRGKDIDAMRATLKAAGLAFRETGVPGARLRQIFVSDPNGILVELNFRDR
jgi:catechol 2,3-dioxygenase-like lactoylglutathione lyase family enzyme